MHRPLVLSILLYACFTTPGFAEIEFVYAIKEKAYEQFGNHPATTPREWGFGAGVSGDGQVTGGTVTYPGSGGPVALMGENGQFDLDDEVEYATQAAMDAAFPNGSISLSVTNNGSATALGPFLIEGDSYPATPHILNAVALGTSDPSQDFTVTWAPFEGSDEGDQVLVQFREDNSDGEEIFEFVDRTDTTFVIPGGTLEANKNYELNVIFINQTTSASESINAIIGYLTNTRVQISTFPQNPEDESIYISRGTFTEQTGAAIPTSVEYSFFAEAFGPGFSSVTVIKPGAGEEPMSPENPEFEAGSFDLEEEYATALLRDADYPEGNYSVRIVNNGVTTTHGPFALSGGTLPVVPGITNWDAAQIIDPDENFTLTWNAFSNAGDEASIELEIWNHTNSENRMEWDLASDAGSIELSSGFLQPNSIYTGEIIFINPSIPTQNSSGVRVDVVYEVFTEFTLQTGDGEGGGGPNDTLLTFYKWERNLQTAADQVQKDGYRPTSTAKGTSNSLTAAQLNASSGGYPLTNVEPNSFRLTTPFGSKENMDANYPAGEYSFDLTENGSPSNYGPYNLPPDGYPTRPLIQNFNDLRNYQSDQSQTITWDTPSIIVTAVTVLVTDESGNQVWSHGLAPEATSTQIPADTLTANADYWIVIQFWSTQITGTNPSAALGYLTSTRMSVQTTSGNGGGGGPGIDGLFLVALKVAKYEQFNSLAPVFDHFEAFTQASDGETAITAFALQYPLGTLDIEEDDGFFEDSNAYDTREAIDANYPNGPYTFKVTQNGVTNDYGPYAMAGTEHPVTPRIINYAALQGFDTSQDITIQFNAFTSQTPDAVIVLGLEVDDGFGGDNPFFEFLEPDVTSYLIPGGTLEPFRIYRGQLIFGNITGTNESNPQALVGYSSEVEFQVSTFPQYNSRSDLELWFSKGTGAIQTTAQNPGPQQWFFFAEGGVSGISSMSVNLPSGTDIILAPTPLESGYFETQATFDSESELDAIYQDGNYHATVVVNGVESTHGPFNLAGGTAPNQPYFTNFNAFQQVDPSQPFTVEWTPFDSPPADGRVSLEIEEAPGYSDLDLDVEGILVTDSSATIPANSLEPNNRYIATLYFERPSETGDDPDVFAGYEAFVQAYFSTTDPTVGPAPATNLTARIESQNSIALNWTDNSVNETGFRIERKALWENQWSALEQAGVNSTSFLDTTVGLGEAYAYRVIVLDGGGDGARSNVAEVIMQPPNDPTGLEVNAYNSNTLTVSWDDNSVGESGFEIDRSTDGSNWANAGNTGSNVNYFTDSGLDTDTTYLYRVRAVSGLGSSNTSDPNSDATFQATDGKPINISTRGTIGADEDSVMIAGFIVTGNESKDIYIRGVAPSLTGVEAALLQDPELVLFDGLQSEIDTNNDWQDHPRAADITATTIPPPDPKEAAIFINLPATPAGVPYTVILRGADGGTGAGLVEVYEANPDNDAKLINISTRGIVNTGDGLMIAGIIVKGTGNRTLYIRGNGPSLPSNLQGRLADTTLELQDSAGKMIVFNDNWRDNKNFASIIATTIPPGFPEEAALLVNVPATPEGVSYTINLRGANQAEGLAIIEVFEVPDTL